MATSTIDTQLNVPYGPEPLQTYDVSVIDPSQPPTKLWIIYIHGGAWRDPRITSTSFSAAASQILSSPAAPHIYAIASLNYRLSPHPEHPSANSARHPDHIHDILSALAALQTAHPFAHRYILVGHSAGATLALQAAMSRSWTADGPARYAADGPAPQANVVPPIAVLGVEGIYDLPLLVERNSHPAYREFVTGAFGDEEGVWARVSPSAGDFTRDTWREGRYVLLAHSREDELVGWEQVEAMERRLKHRGWARRVGEGVGRGYEVLELTGMHDQVWEEGRELARAIEHCVSKVVGLLE